MNEDEAIKQLMVVARRLETQDEFDEAVGMLCKAFDETNEVLAEDPEYRNLCLRNRALIVKVAEMGKQRQLVKQRAWDQVDPPGNN